uniref:Protein tyrosine phosphatase domain-containing protein 1 n=1 Tax=Latimeria chalumnae TaxID=7897 RepID=H3BDV4_LATCH
MQGPARRHSAVDFLSKLFQGRRHSTSDILLRVLQRRRSSVIEMLPSSTHQVMVAVSSLSTTEANIHLSQKKSVPRRPTAKYTKVGERLRHVIPGHMQCSMACGGRACKYENPSKWSEQEQAIKGLYSSWITDNVLAMSRPSTEIIEKYNIIAQFQSYGIKTVINLQRPGEHASCGNSLEQESGFTYLPEAFMEAGIYFYNFGWKDYGVASLTTILDMLKVMSFALQEGKVAIHCHAGLGRTGVLIACYLVFATRMSADQAILFVRAKRPNSIQTRGQLLCVREFAQFLIPLRNVFACCEPKAHAVTLPQYLIRQRHLLHGYEARQLKHVPKIVHLICKLLLDFAENRQVFEEETLEIPDLSAEIEKTVSQLAIMQLDKELEEQEMGGTVSLAQTEVSTASSIPNNSLLSSEQDFDPLWKRRNAEFLQPLSKLKKRVSYSDSDLRRVEFLLEQGVTPLTVPAQTPYSRQFRQYILSQSNICPASQIALKKLESSVNTISTLWDHKPMSIVDEQTEKSPRFQRIKLPKEAHRSRTFSIQSSFMKYNEQLDISNGPKKEGSNAEELISTNVNKHNESSMNDKSICGSHKNSKFTIIDASSLRGPSATSTAVLPVGDAEEKGKIPLEEIPYITLQTELSLESRRVLAAKALAGFQELANEGITEKVLEWQRDLNSREGAWERLCTEKDPFILSTLMWSWIEQLKDPVITKDDTDILSKNCTEPFSALFLLEK